MEPIQSVEKCEINISLRNGSLIFVVDFVSIRGSVLPFIIRKLILLNDKQRVRTEQHGLIKSAEELSAWIAKDEFSFSHPEAFDKLKTACLRVLV
jgi:hypothetical protein